MQNAHFPFTHATAHTLKRLKVLLLGNGINRIDNDYSWEHLMNDLLDYAEKQNAISLKEKPFPLVYEEIYLRWMNDAKRLSMMSGNIEDPDEGRSSQERSGEWYLKNKIAALIRNIKSSTLHRKAININVDEILTTNYDLNLEAVGPGGVKGAPYIPPVKGSKYSIMRRRKVGNKIVWHIHGEINAPGSILLGYEQYAGYLQNVRNYMIEGMSYREKGEEFQIGPLTTRLRAKERAVQSWVDHFFLNDVYILGLNMDFVEMHLWWILDFRARLQHDARYTINNRIVYLYPAKETHWIKPRIDLLCACGVSCIALPVEDNNWKGMYSLAMDYIDERAASPL